MIESGNFSDFNLRRLRALSECPDRTIAEIVNSHIDEFPKTLKLLTETTRFYTENFPELQQYIKREKRLIVFETPSRVSITHEYTVEGIGGKLNNGFYFLFNALERLSWLKISLEGHRVSIASKEKVVAMLLKSLGAELDYLSAYLGEVQDKIAWSLYNAADGKPCFVEFNQKEQKCQQSLLFCVSFFDSIRNKSRKGFDRWFSPLQEKELLYNYSTISDNANAWVYFKAPSNFVLNVTHNAQKNEFEESKSNDDEITSLVLKPHGERLSVDFKISVNVPKALKVWYNGMFWLAFALTLFGVLLTIAQFKMVDVEHFVETFNNCAFAIVAAIIATRGWLMSEEQVMKKMSNGYTFFVILLIFIIILLSAIPLFRGADNEQKECNCSQSTNIGSSIPVINAPSTIEFINAKTDSVDANNKQYTENQSNNQDTISKKEELDIQKRSVVGIVTVDTVAMSE